MSTICWWEVFQCHFHYPNICWMISSGVSGRCNVMVKVAYRLRSSVLTKKKEAANDTRLRLVGVVVICPGCSFVLFNPSPWELPVLFLLHWISGVGGLRLDTDRMVLKIIWQFYSAQNVIISLQKSSFSVVHYSRL